MQTTKLSLSILALGAASSFGAIVWTVGDSATAGRQAPEIWSHNGSSGTTTFVQEGNGPTNPIPGDQFSPALNQQADDDFYFAGNYTNQVDGGPIYTPHGIVAATEAGIERAVTNGDSTNRIHFNFQGSALPTDVYTVSFAMIDLNDNDTGTGQYDFALSVNGISLGNFAHTQATIGTTFTSDPFTLADVNGTAGAPDDNYVELVASNDGTAARWSNFDYIQMDRTDAIPEPSSTGLALLSIAGLSLIRRRK